MPAPVGFIPDNAPEGFMPDESPSVSKEDALKFGVGFSAEVPSMITRLLESGAEGSEMGREQGKAERARDPLGLGFPGLGPARSDVPGAFPELGQTLSATPGLLGKFVAGAGRTLRDVVSPSTYLPVAEQPRPFIISPEGIGKMTPEQAAAREPLAAGRPLVQLPRTQLDPEGTDFGKQVEALTTPESIGMIAAGEVAPKVGLGLLATMVPGIVDDVKAVVDSDVSPQEKRDRINGLIVPAVLGLNSMRSRGGTPSIEKGMGKSLPVEGQPTSSESIPNRPPSGAELLSNSTGSEPFQSEGLRGLDVPSQRSMMSSVLTSLKDPEIFDSVIKSIPVDVVNVLRGVEPSSEVRLHEPSVFSHLAAINSDNSVSMSIDVAENLARATASAIREKFHIADLTRKETKGATETRKEQQSSQPEYPGTPPQRIPTETGGSDLPLGETPVQAQTPDVVKPPEIPPSPPAVTQQPTEVPASLATPTLDLKSASEATPADFFKHSKAVTDAAMAGQGPSLQVTAENAFRANPDVAAWEKAYADAQNGASEAMANMRKALEEAKAKGESQEQAMIDGQEAMMGAAQKSQFFAEGLKIAKAEAKPTEAPEKITGSAVRAEGQVHTGANHPEILDKLGIKGFETPESRNTPDFGFITDKGRFITREEAGPIAKTSGQDLKAFEPGEPVHSNEVASPTEPGKPLSETKAPITENSRADKPIGMGAAVSEEFERNPETPTGIRNAIVDKERVKRGLPEAMKVARRSFGEVWDRTMAMLDRDPTIQDTLLNELRDKPRALTDVEDALILHRQIDLQNEYGKATRDLAQAYDDGRIEDVAREKVRVAGLADKLYDLYNIGKTSGTETARGLSARRMMANEDFSLANMVTEKRAANGGKPLTESQQSEVDRLHKIIAMTLKSLDDYRKKLEEQRSKSEPAPKTPPVLDPVERRMAAENERAKAAWRDALSRDRLRIRSPLEKAQDALVRWRRAFILSSPITLAKLTSAAIERMTFTPIEEAVGGAIGLSIPKVAQKAAREGGGINARAEAKALTEGFTSGMKDSWDVLRTGRSDLDALYGRAAGYPPGVSDFFGHVHGALKSVTKRNEFARSFEKRSSHAIAQGVDVSDPLVQTGLAIEAYKDANRSIFQQDNRVVTAYKAALRTLEQKAKDTGKTPLGAKAVATTGKILLPVVKIPTNIVAETLQTATGLITGSVRLGRALASGLDNLTPQEADTIMRSLKKGSIGGAMLALGYLNADVIGGYYQPGKKKPGQQGFGTLKLYGHEIPSYLLHNPLLETLQLGATIRKVAESRFHKKESETKGLGWGGVGAGLGLLEEVPFLREPIEVAKAMNPNEQRSFFGELFKSLTVPQGVQWWATYRDTDKYGNPIQRKATTLAEHVKTGVPGLRETVPQKPSP